MVGLRLEDVVTSTLSWCSDLSCQQPLLNHPDWFCVCELLWPCTAPWDLQPCHRHLIGRLHWQWDSWTYNTLCFQEPDVCWFISGGFKGEGLYTSQMEESLVYDCEFILCFIHSVFHIYTFGQIRVICLWSVGGGSSTQTCPATGRRWKLHIEQALASWQVWTQNLLIVGRQCKPLIPLCRNSFQSSPKNQDHCKTE